ncbi:DGQHR domain-containing protein (plasmid) [Shewanella xiamenensis]|nr:DNA sulfur modification protein DndB [Shewanella xiamenensis]WHF57876.1 DGQHR domain-containing protein [Shewanella xiamenensis]
MQMTESDFTALSHLYEQMTGQTDLVIYAIGGKEGDRFTYVGKLSFEQLIQHYQVVPTNVELPTYLQLQRELVKNRSTGIRQYLLNNDDHIFPELISISKTIDAHKVEPVEANIFRITIPAASFRYLVDGQGRLVGIREAFAESAKFVNQTVDVKFVLSESVQRDAQLFSDVNSTPIAPNKSQCAAMDSRQVINTFAKRVIVEVEGLAALVEFNKASVTASSKSPALWTLNQLISFILILIGGTPKSCQTLLDDDEKQKTWIDFISKFFLMLNKNQHFANAFSRSISAQECRAVSIVGTSVCLKSLGLMAKVIAMNFIHNGASSWDSLAAAWANVDLGVDNDEFIGRCKNFRGGFEDRSFNHRALASYFLQNTDLYLPDDLEAVEEEVLINRAGIKKLQRQAKRKLEAEQGTDNLEVAE